MLRAGDGVSILQPKEGSQFANSALGCRKGAWRRGGQTQLCIRYRASGGSMCDKKRPPNAHNSEIKAPPDKAVLHRSIKNWSITSIEIGYMNFQGTYLRYHLPRLFLPQQVPAPLSSKGAIPNTLVETSSRTHEQLSCQNTIRVEGDPLRFF